MGQNPCKHLIENRKKELTEEEFKALLDRYDTSLLFALLLLLLVVLLVVMLVVVLVVLLFHYFFS